MSTKINKTCEYCTEEFAVAKSSEVKRFCSRKCYDTNRKEKATKICPTCQRPYVAQLKKQIHCSNKCKAESQRDRISCICGCCGKSFERKKSEVINSKRHYCSNRCRKSEMFWSIEDISILRENYRKISTNEISKLLSKQWSDDAVRRKAKALKLGVPREWSGSEISILTNYYSIAPMNEVQKLLPNRSPSSILGKARTSGLLSHFYLSSKYSIEEDNYLKENYLRENNKTLAVKLNRTPSGIMQRLAKLKLHRPLEISNYGTLNFFTRQRIVPWRDKELRKNNYTCALSGKHRNVVIHHIRGFNMLILEVIEAIDFPVYEHIESYSQDELDYFLNEFLLLQEYYGEYICISEDIHKMFHSRYGYGNNTIEQWNEFLTYYNKNVA